MEALADPKLERASLRQLALRRPWLPLSAAAHGVLLLALIGAGPVRVELRRDEGLRAQVDESLRQTARREMQRELRSMEEIRDALESSSGRAPAGEGRQGGARGAPPASDPARRARQLMEAIGKVQQEVRAAEMARVLGIPENEALRRVQAEEAGKPKAALPKGRPEAVVAKLAADARAALAQRRAQLMAQQQGVKLSQQGQQRGPGSRGGQGGQTGQLAKTADAGQGGLGAMNGGVATNGPGGQSASMGGRLDALASGLGMNTPTALAGSSLDMSSEGFSDQRRYGEFLAPPVVDAATVRTGAGRTLGRGGSYANRIYLNTWYVIGPFAGRGRDSIEAVYPPERGVDLDAVYYGKNDEPVRWIWQQDTDYPFVPRPRAESAVYYAYTEVMVEEDTDMWMHIGGDDDTRLWFNDRLVWNSGDGDKPWYRQPYTTLDTQMALLNLTEGQRKLHFHKGRNTILLKLYNGTNLMFFSVVLTPA